MTYLLIFCLTRGVKSSIFETQQCELTGALLCQAVDAMLVRPTPGNMCTTCFSLTKCWEIYFYSFTICINYSHSLRQHGNILIMEHFLNFAVKLKMPYSKT